MGRDAAVGDQVDVVSGPHEGRSGVIKRMQPVSIGYRDPEWYAIVGIKVVNSDDRLMDDEISVPVRRLKPR